MGTNNKNPLIIDCTILQKNCYVYFNIRYWFSLIPMSAYKKWSVYITQNHVVKPQKMLHERALVKRKDSEVVAIFLKKML